MPKITWIEYRKGNERNFRLLDNETERILGRVVCHDVPGGGYEYSAYDYARSNPFIGRYLSPDTAKRRVEESVGQMQEVAQ
jgi:hypothetical protein